MTITQERLKELVNYDPNTGVFTNKAQRGNLLAGAETGYEDGGYIKLRLDKKLYKAHRLAFLYMTGSFPSSDTDHVNGIKNDNRFCNLRQATRGENMMNIGIKKHNTSGYKGVTFYKKTGKWKAQIQANKKKISLGYFDDIREAAEAYIFAALDMHGDYTRIT